MEKHKITEDMFNQRFIIGTKLSKGATSQVYKARDTRDSNNVRAIRVSRATDDYGSSKERLLTKFKSETEIMQALQGSPYVVKLFEAYVMNALDVYHVMELAEAGELKAHIPRFGMTSDRALACMQQIFSGLAFVHSQNIIHYDVKPENVLVFGDGRLKLADFDVSLRVHGHVVRDTYGVWQEWYPYAGTVDYMAPEIRHRTKTRRIGNRNHVEYRTISALKHEDDVFKVDIFSAGVMFLELLTHSYGDIVLGSYENIKEAYLQALRVEKAHREDMREVNPGKKMGKLCNRCKKLFQYTLRKIHKRKSAAKIVDAMRTWTLHPKQFGFDDAKSKSIVAQMVQRRGGDARGGTRGESKVQLRL